MHPVVPIVVLQRGLASDPVHSEKFERNQRSRVGVQTTLLKEGVTTGGPLVGVGNEKPHQLPRPQNSGYRGHIVRVENDRMADHESSNLGNKLVATRVEGHCRFEADGHGTRSDSNEHVR